MDKCLRDAGVSDTFKSSDERVQNLAAKYAVSDYAATYIVRAIVLAEQKDSSGLTDLGLEKEDFAAIYRGDEIADEKIDALSAKLRISRASASSLVNQMSSDIQDYRDR